MRTALTVAALVVALLASFIAGVEVGYDGGNTPHTVHVTLTCKPTQVQDVPGNPPIYTYECEAH